jgi:hypothetical protein
MRLPFVSRAAYNTQAEELADALIVNGCLTDDLTAARRRLAEYEGRRTVAEVLEDHDVHRKALADALGASQHLTWDQLLITARRAREALGECRAEADAERKRADSLETGSETGRLKRRVAHLQRQLDDAVGLPPGRIEDSRRWQPGYQKPTGGAS